MAGAVEDSNEDSKVPARRPWLKWLGIVVALVAIFFAFRLLPLKEGWVALKGALETLGPAGWILFVVVYALATVLLLPASLLTIGAGALYGPYLGVLLVWIGAVLGANAAFLLGRTILRRRIEQWAARQTKFQAVDHAVAKEGAKIVFLVRLSPLFPFNFTNYAFGLTGVSFWGYAIATAIGILPGTIAYVLVGYAGEGILEGGGKAGLTVVAAIATLAVSILVARVAKKAIEKAS